MIPQAQVDLTQNAGRWRVWARRPGFEPVEVTWVRGVPTQVGEMSWQDPFGPNTATLKFPAVTMYDKIGSGELFWLAAEVDFTIEWAGPMPTGYPFATFAWEGFCLPIEYTQDEVSISLIGALHQLDDCLAKPEYTTNPLPYEVAIARQWLGRVDLRVKPLEVRFPSWWTQVYTPQARALPALVPNGVAPGAKWTGLLTRETGSWDKVLTSYIQSMLASMYTERGRWTIDMEPGRTPVMLHRDFKYDTDAATIRISPLQPGVEASLTEDWSQSANVFYGQSTSLRGEAYSGEQVIDDGRRTVYRPLAALRQVEPTTDRNTWLQRDRMRREQMLQVQQGLSPLDLIKVGQNHLQHSSDPGVTGTITLTSDPRMDGGQVIARHLIRAGMTVYLEGFKSTGVLLHVTETSYSSDGESMTLTVDSKYRDRLTVSEVRIRGRDALNVPRSLLAGRIKPLVDDNLVPWNYALGSGYIPSSPTYNARRLFEDITEDIDLSFPYEALTTRRPPRQPAWRTCYIKIGPANKDKADYNWAYAAGRPHPAKVTGLASHYAFPIRMGQAGAVRSLQLAAYDADGNVMPVGFHYSIYYSRGTNVASMPKMPAGKIPFGSTFHTGDHYPFFEGAFEDYDEAGVQRGIEVTTAVQTVGLIRGWGTRLVKAGYWPGTSRDATNNPTGLLVDESVWEWTLSGKDNVVNPYTYQQVSPYAGYLYAMIYCDQQGDEPVYFMGRMFRVEPGLSAS